MKRLSEHQTTSVVVSGLPASGKTTLARALAQALDWPLLDKDDFLEALYDAHPVATLEDRSTLSRQSDVHFQRAAEAVEHCVLVSHWAVGTGASGGTPTGWLNTRFERVVEVCCVCAAQTATTRFKARRRHPKHMDHLRPHADLLRQMQDRSMHLPLNIGDLIVVDTETQVDVAAVVAKLT